MALPATETSNTFSVSWAGEDDPGGSGLADFNVYVADDDGPFTLWQNQTAGTSATFTGQNRHTYSFLSQALDNVGNMELLHSGADTQTLVNAPDLQFDVSAASGATAGSPVDVTVTAEDSSANVVSAYTGTVHFIGSDSAGVLPEDYTFTGADAGVHVFQVIFATPGTQSVTATDTLSVSITGSRSLTVTNGAPTAQLVGPATAVAKNIDLPAFRHQPILCGPGRGVCLFRQLG